MKTLAHNCSIPAPNLATSLGDFLHLGYPGICTDLGVLILIMEVKELERHWHEEEAVENEAHFPRRGISFGRLSWVPLSFEIKIVIDGGTYV